MTVCLYNMENPTGLTFKFVLFQGFYVTCIGCGLDYETSQDNGIGTWEYEVDDNGIDLWVRATCRGCRRVEIFVTTGGKKSGYIRDLNDLDRKHREEHTNWLRRTLKHREITQ